MAVTHRSGIRKGLRRWLYSLRRWLPVSMRLYIWKRTGTELLERKGYLQRLPLFRSLELETRTRCNSTCAFCAASILTDQRPDLLMPDETWEKILTELEDLKYAGAVKFFVNNEPLLDPKLVERVRALRARVPRARTEVHTNGLKLNPRNGRELMEAGLHLLYINNYTENGEMHRGVKAFLEEVAPEFPDREIVFHLRLLQERLQNRGGTAPNATAEPEPLALPCVLPFEEMIVTADGRVTICCQDHDFSEAVGNVNASSLREIWEGTALQQLRARLAQADRSANPLCAACDFRGFKQEHIEADQAFRNRVAGDLLHF